MPIISAFGILRQKDHEYKASLGYIVNSRLARAIQKGSHASTATIDILKKIIYTFSKENELPKYKLQSTKCIKLCAEKLDKNYIIEDKYCLTIWKLKTLLRLLRQKDHTSYWFMHLMEFPSWWDFCRHRKTYYKIWIKKNTGFGPSRVFGEGTEKWEEFLFSSQREELVETRPQVTAAI